MTVYRIFHRDECRDINADTPAQAVELVAKEAKYMLNVSDWHMVPGTGRIYIKAVGEV